MTGIVNSLLLFISLAITLTFFAYGFNILYMIHLAKKYREPTRVPIDSKPSVAVHLPIYNERYVAERLVASCVDSAQQYGKDLVHITILDDSDDETTEILEKTAAQYRSKGFNVTVLHRSDRSGYKAGALNHALMMASEDYLVVFDSDFLPRKEFFDTAISYIMAHKKLGVVQFRWNYANRNYNWITKSVAIGMDAHFLIEQPGRFAGGLFLNFNGSAGIIRVSALKESGGWQTDTLAEDLDMSYRIQMKEYQIKYVMDDVLCEITPTVASFKRQQGRWARGSLQVTKKLLPQLMRRPDIGVKKKFEAFIHLTYYGVHPLMFASFLLTAFAAIFNIDSIKVVLPTQQEIQSLGTIGGSTALTTPVWILFGFFILLSTTAAWIYYLMAMKMQHFSVLRNLQHLVTLGFLGYGISVSNSVQATKAFLLSSSGKFERTPKYAIIGSNGSWKDKKYQVPLDITTMIEAGSIVLATIAIIRALYFTNYGILVILGVYFTSFLLVFSGTILQRGKDKVVISSLPSP